MSPGFNSCQSCLRNIKEKYAHPPRMSLPSVDAASENTQNLRSSGLQNTHTHTTRSTLQWYCTANRITTTLSMPSHHFKQHEQDSHHLEKQRYCYDCYELNGSLLLKWFIMILPINRITHSVRVSGWMVAVTSSDSIIHPGGNEGGGGPAGRE